MCALHEHNILQLRNTYLEPKKHSERIKQLKRLQQSCVRVFALSVFIIVVCEKG